MLLTVESLKAEASSFVRSPLRSDGVLFGINDGKTIGSFVEKAFKNRLRQKYEFDPVDLATGIDLPLINVDIKTSRVSRPQSSCPYESAEQKVYGLGYNLLVFLYEKTDDERTQSAKLDIERAIFIDKEVTGDYRTSKGLLDILAKDANGDDVVAYLLDMNLPLDDNGAKQLAKKIIETPPRQGCLTISNALQWRLQFNRAISLVNDVGGVLEL